jgi:hypothetical protein
MSVDRKKMKESLYQRTKEAYERRESSGRFQGIFIDSLPEGLSQYKVGEGEHVLDVIPFLAGEMLGKSIIQDKVSEGDPVYVVEVFVHRSIGPTQRDVVCPARWFGTRCPVCEIVDKLYDKDDLTENEQTLLDKHVPKRRTIYNIVCRNNNKEIAKGVQMWEVAYWLFERHISELVQLPHGGGWINFTDPDEGKSVGFKRKGMGATSTEYLKHQFLDREPITDEVLKNAYTLDALIQFHSFEEIFEMFFQMPYDGQPVTLELLTGKRPVATPPAEEKTEEESPPVEEVPVGADNPCPHGHVFGGELDKHDDCKKCKKWDDCADENDRIQLAKKREERRKSKGESEDKEEKPQLRR